MHVDVHQAPARVEEKHVDVHVEAPHPAPRVDVHVEAPRPAAHVDVQVHRDWDDNDEDGRHYGGYAPNVAGRLNRGERIRALPSRYFRLHFGNFDYFLDDDGIYYQPQPDGQYVVIQPPVGIVAAALPAGVTPIVLGPTTFYYLDGDFYVAQNGGFAVVNPPAGIVVPTLPGGANQVVINGTVVYQFNGFNYQPSLQDGVTVYTVNPA